MRIFQLMLIIASMTRHLEKDKKEETLLFVMPQQG
jgi:hypothetical protein